IPGSPALTPQAWRRLLEAQGFVDVRHPAEVAHGLGQQIVVGLSDGIVRQRQTVAAPLVATPSHGLPAQDMAPRSVRESAASIGDALEEKLQSSLARAAAELLKLAPERIDPQSELSKFGFDSITLASFANVVNDQFGLELTPTVFFEYPTLAGLSEHLVREHRAVLARQLGGTERASAAVRVTIGDALEERLQLSLARAAAALLKLAPERIDPQSELSKFGFDSITLASFANVVNDQFGLELTPTVFFEYPTLAGLSEHLVREHRAVLAGQLGGTERAYAAVKVTTSDALEERLQSLLARAAAELLKLEPEQIDPQVELSKFGFDSITLASFANVVNDQFGLALTPTVFFEYPTLAALVEHLVREHRAVLVTHLGDTVAAAPERAVAQISIAPPTAGRRPRARFAQAMAMPPERHAAAPAPAAVPVKPEPIAIIGVSGAFPQAEDLEDFWANLASGRDCIGEIP
ncbi:acyl carrier protein, partial [Variovorax sp. YR750]|uniref:acyl carrier protein n=1 Tax=Variovorax sp. YR750 TaxID=1884384 RepID=UPI001160D681